MFTFLMMNSVATPSQVSDTSAPKTSVLPNVDNQVDNQKDAAYPKVTTYSNGDIRLDFADGTYDTKIAFVKMK